MIFATVMGSKMSEYYEIEEPKGTPDLSPSEPIKQDRTWLWGLIFVVLIMALLTGAGYRWGEHNANQRADDRIIELTKVMPDPCEMDVPIFQKTFGDLGPRVIEEVCKK